MHAIDISKGSLNGTVSQQWATRPDDEKFLSLSELKAQVKAWREASYAEEAKPGQISLRPDPDTPTGLLANVNGIDGTLTHFGFQQVSWLARCPADYLRRIPAQLAAINLNYGLRSTEQKEIAAYMLGGENQKIRGITSPRYGRIFDEDVVAEIMKFAGDGTGDTRWKVPGTIEWGSQFGVSYNPEVEITTQNTTLYASDRDIFIFLVDDMNPIEVGKLANGDPDLMFRGFYVWNSEVGHSTFGVATMYLRGVCQNRNLWGVEDFSETTFKHTAGAPDRFTIEAAPALQQYTEASTQKLIEGVTAAKAAKVSVTEEERLEFLAKFGFSAKQSKMLIERSIAEEGKPQETVWDHAQAVSAQARFETLQEKRLGLEQTAGKMLDLIKV